MLQEAVSSTSVVASDTDPIRWNRSLSKAFDVAREQFPAASAEEALVSKYLDVEIKFLERRRTSIMAVRMGAFLTALDEEIRSWRVDDIRNLDWQGKETTPLYETIGLNSTKSQDFLIDGMRFLRQEDAAAREMATLRLQPRWYGLDVTAYGLRSAGTAQSLLGRITSRAKDINFLKGEAFSLSGEFLPKTGETFSDLFLDPVNAAAIDRIVRLINQRGKALENRGVLLMGPPGTGKTLSARIVRNEAEATFIWVSSRDFHYSGSFGGFTEAFDLARECAPSVIVFEDVDNWLYDTTVDLLKSEMDGVAVRSGVVTMMTTNFPELLPAALIDRPGRFHDVLRFGLPDADARKQMLQRWLPGLADVDLNKAVIATAGYSGAHVKELTRFAAIIAEQDNLSLPKALTAALAKLAEQRELITDTQRQGSRFRMPSALVGKVGVRLERPRDYAEKGDSIDKMYRAHSDLRIKTIEESGRKFSGIATTPRPDREGDVIEPLGVQFSNPMPLLLFHNGKEPVGEVFFGKATSDGIPFTATIPEVTEPGIVKDLTDRAAHNVKYRLTKAVSIGFRSFMDSMERIKDTGGWRFLKSEVMELSLVSVPAQPDALIHSVKAFDKSSAALGAIAPNTAGVSASPRTVKLRPERTMKKTFADQIANWENTRAAKAARQESIQQKATDEGRSKDESEREEFTTLSDELKGIDSELADLRDLEAREKAAAIPVAGRTPIEGAQSRTSTITVDKKLPPGINFARYAMCMGMARGNPYEAKQLAKDHYGDDGAILIKLIDLQQKGAIGAANAQTAGWASELVPYNIMDDFIEFLRPRTILGKFGTTVNGTTYPSLRRVPFNTRVSGFSSGTSAAWVGEGLPILLSKGVSMTDSLTWAKLGALAVLTKEEIRFSNPNAEAKVRDDLAAALVQKMDIDLVNPARAAVANVSPASVTWNTTPVLTTGTSAATFRTDFATLIGTFATALLSPEDIVIIMSTVDALNLSLMITSLGNQTFPGMTMGGGYLMGFPVITTTAMVATGSPSSTIIVALKASEIYLADDGEATVEASDQASVEMVDSSSQTGIVGTGASLVSFWQDGLVGLKVVRAVNWKKRRSTAARYIYNAAYRA